MGSQGFVITPEPKSHLRLGHLLPREASVKTKVFAALLLASTLTAANAAAQLAPVNQAGVTMGHWHIASKDVEANKKLFVAMAASCTCLAASR